MKLRTKIKRVRDVELPKYAKTGDSGFDLVAAEDTIIWPGETKVVQTGLSFEIPPGYELQVRPRSGMTRNTKLRVVLGTVDSGYRGEVGVLVDNTERPISLNMQAHVIEKGTRIAQGVIAPVVTAHFVEVEELSVSERGVGGFGSTGTK
ncbi:deoxyuridine 5'-triphosphate nucleotidohydrolase [Bacillus cereus]|uniref:dUTP diphosphatase n=2 Tax=Hubeivirus PfEFR4 TaxID=2843780 RepID=A0A1B1P7U8_9CAUD|nr:MULTISPECIES: dUTP diphosphatase [Bacillus cereus group]YP_009285291.1 dUTPase [Bacillus phage PfEFR-5]YP_009830775.1 dUTPase [Bacillus phage PfEFR-4]EJR10490.1 dUTP diphosphatase [Bacillus cereus MSX-A12]KXI84462.1 deoxyuridine 5'-triphosphate nucleotidohydrolase [Bacillus cereus]ANT40186.1 deoxyuridine 5'-triphosphate nucleotidohydrolase [Bacillus phage PfEFR-4]ANT40416.1 deoxyuridine 5'-triphosphate nucleotidohydrolase [Bacillus phage PfEFR-5]MDX5889761.1 dUTP diphosphatase [Bacillus c